MILLIRAVSMCRSLILVLVLVLIPVSSVRWIGGLKFPRFFFFFFFIEDVTSL